MHHTVVAFGEILWDILPSDRVLGGAPFNFAYRINTLGDRGIPVSRLGRDALGEKAVDLVGSLGLSDTYIQWDRDHATGTVRVRFNEHDVPDYMIVPDVAYDYIESTEYLDELAEAADCVYFGTLIQRSVDSRTALQRLLKRASEAVKFLDLNLRRLCYSRETIADSLEAADTLKLNEQELRQLAALFSFPSPSLIELGEEALRRWALKRVLITLGERGALGLGSQGERAYVPGYRVQIVDTVGSGDAFSAGFVHSYLQGKSLADSLELGCSLGALVATKTGGTSPVLKGELVRLRECNPERIYDDAVRQELGLA